MSAPSSDNERLLSKGYKAWLLTVLLIVCTFNFADRAILAVLAQPIKEDLGLTDSQLGLLQGLAFAILYSVLGVPLGWLAERKSRKAIIAVCVAVWSAMTVACGFATNFVTLLLGRVGVGVGEAGFLSPTSSLLADHYKSHSRASVLAVVMLGTPIGYLLGSTVGAWVAAQWSWREAFFAMGAPGLVIAALVWLTLKEPPRGLAEGSVSTEPPPSIPSVIKRLWAMPTFRHVLIGAAVAGLTLNAVGQFWLQFLLRSHSMDIKTAGLVFGLTSFFANGIGTLVGGFGVDWISRRDARWALWGPALGLALTIPVYLVAFSTGNLWLSVSCVFVGNLLLITFYTPTFATVQNLVGPRMRASSVALFSLVFSLVGAGLGPTVLGMLSDMFAVQAFTGGDFFASCPGGRAPAGAETTLDAACRGASGLGLRHALMAVQALFVWAVIHYLLAARTLRKDLYQPG